MNTGTSASVDQSSIIHLYEDCRGALNPQIASVLEQIAGTTEPAGPAADMESIDRIRESTDVLNPYRPRISHPVVSHDESYLSFDGTEIRIRRYFPASSNTQRALLYFHGGCWTFCGLESHDAICRYLCHNADTAVFSVEYRLAPENKFPVALQDGLAALSWVHRGAERMGISPQLISVAGDSAGANLAAALCLLCRDRNCHPIESQLLYYPILDLNIEETGSWRDFAEGYFYSLRDHEFAIRSYTRSVHDLDNPYASPLRAGNLRRLPRTMIVTAEFDILRDEGERFAVALSGAGVPVVAYRYCGTVHAFAAMAGSVDAGRDALDRGSHFLRRSNSGE